MIRLIGSAILLGLIVGCSAPQKDVSNSAYEQRKIATEAARAESEKRQKLARAQRAEESEKRFQIINAKYKPYSDTQYIQEAKAVVTGKLKDPNSASFRNVRIVHGKKVRKVCGEVNAKNSYGGYSGFKTFSFANGSATIDSNTTDKIRKLGNELLLSECR